MRRNRRNGGRSGRRSCRNSSEGECCCDCQDWNDGYCAMKP